MRLTDNITVYNADCMEYMAGLENNAFDLAIVDPPYGIGADENQKKLSGKRGFSKGAGTYKKYHDTDWDKNIPHESYFKSLKRISKNQVVWGGNYFHSLHLSGIIVWYKGNSGNFKEGELAKTNINTFRVYNYSRSDAYINDCLIKIHPTQKPVKLYEWILKNYANEGDRILDTHLGSGSSAIACHNYGYEFVGMELDKDYFNDMVKRFKQVTAQKALAI